MNRKVLAIIGGGASGTAAAIEAAKYSDSDTSTVIFERLPKIGKKLLATGNGRCNIMNESADPSMYGGDVKLAERVFEKYPPESNRDFFADMGLLLKSEEAGRLYPMSFQASCVLDALRFELERLNIELKCDCKVEKIERKNGGFLINESFFADSVIIAGGGKSASVQGSDGSCFELLKSLGVKIKPYFPSLTGITLKNKNKILKGVRAESEILIVENSAVVSCSRGELQYTDYGVSGIPAMEVSRAVSEHFALHKKGKVYAAINSLPDFTGDEIFEYILNVKKHNPSLLCENLLSGVMNKKLGNFKLQRAEIDPKKPIGSLTDSEAASLTESVSSDIFEISGVLGFENSQVTAGGADARQFSAETLEALRIPGLFACGEVMNVDGRCGGYNLGWAWSSGRLAGKSAAICLNEKSKDKSRC